MKRDVLDIVELWRHDNALTRSGCGGVSRTITMAGAFAEYFIDFAPAAEAVASAAASAFRCSTTAARPEPDPARSRVMPPATACLAAMLMSRVVEVLPDAGVKLRRAAPIGVGVVLTAV